MYSILKEKIDIALFKRNKDKNYLIDIGKDTIPNKNAIRLYGPDKIINKTNNERSNHVVYLYAQDNIRIKYGIESYIHPHNLIQPDALNFVVMNEEVVTIGSLDSTKINQIFSFLCS